MSRRWPIALLVAAWLLGTRRGQGERAYVARSQWEGALKWLPDLAAQVPSDTPNREQFVRFLLRWIAIESGGNPYSIGNVREVGIWQIYFPDDRPVQYGVTREALHPPDGAELTEPQRQLQVSTGLAMVAEYMRRATELLAHAGLEWRTTDQYVLAKLYHNLPALYAWFPIAARQGHAVDWDGFAAWLRGVTHAEAMAIDRQVGFRAGGGAAPYWPFARYASNAERAGRGPLEDHDDHSR